MVEIAVPDGTAYRFGATCHTGTAAFCGVSSRAYGGGHPERDGDEGLFTGTIFCPATGGLPDKRESDTARCGYTAVY